MATFKGDNSLTSLAPEDNGFAKPLTSYDGVAKLMQNNDGTFNSTRNALESEARTSNAELAGVRLGNKQIAATFPIELDPLNQNKLWESVLYGRFDNTGTPQSLTGVNVSAAKPYNMKVPLTLGEQSALGLKIGNMYHLGGISVGDLTHLEGVVVAIESNTSSVTFMNPNQTEASITATASDITVTPVNTLRPDKQVQSFNAEETIFAEDGSETARFMTTGVVASGVSVELPSEGLITGSFSFIGSNHIASKKYEDFDNTLTNEVAAHTNVIDHTRFDPLVLQDGAIISDNSNTLAQWLSGSISIENGVQTYFTGASYEARGSFSGSLRLTATYEVLFESEDDYLAFEAETSSKMMLKLKERNSENCLVIYVPNLKRTAYTKNNGKGLVSASVTATAVIDTTAANSFVIGQYNV